MIGTAASRVLGREQRYRWSTPGADVAGER
jgi:hypothetical protein